MPGDFKQRLSSAEVEDLLAFLGRQSIRQAGAAVAKRGARRPPAARVTI